jgi:outer membrane protein assembly factor BamB
MRETTEQVQTKYSSGWSQTLRTTAIVAGVFSAIFLGLIVWNLIGSAVVGPARENRLTAMKVQLNEEPENAELLPKIRQLDLKIRRNRLWRWDFSRRAAWMLLGSVVVFVVAAKLTHIRGQQPPRPQAVIDADAVQVRQARSARWAVVGVLAALVAGGALLSRRSVLQFIQAQEAGPAFATAQEKAQQWHRFRGPEGAGVTPFTNIPTRWDGQSGQGILWKTEVPLIGHNSPIVWRDRVFLSGATEDKRQVYCFDAQSGRLLWTGDVPSVPAVAEAELDLMPDTGYAACTMATDGRRAYAIFATGDIAAFDFNGRRLWHKNLGVPDSIYGYASSLDTYEDKVIVQYDQGDGTDGKSHLYALDGRSGRVVWDVKREVPNSWTSPIIADVEGTLQLIALADPWVIAYRPGDGSEIWRAECVGGDVAPSPVYAGGLVFAIEPYGQLVAIKPTGQGNVTESHIAWRMEEGGPDICSPVSDGQHVWLLESEGLLICCNVADGEMVSEHDFRESFLASPTLVGDQLYLLDVEGVMHIGQAGPEYKETAKCELGEECHASPAFADGRIYIRSTEHLYCIGQTASADR